MTEPETRIGDTERTSAIEALGEHMRAGRLDPHEYDERVERATTARVRSDLDPLFVDLPAPGPAWTAPSPRVALGKSAPTATGGAPGTTDDPGAPDAPAVRDDHEGPLGGRVGTTLVAASPFIALILFFATGYQWWWWLLVPLSGAIVYGGLGRGGRNRDDRYRARDERRRNR